MSNRRKPRRPVPLTGIEGFAAAVTDVGYETRPGGVEWLADLLRGPLEAGATAAQVSAVLMETGFVHDTAQAAALVRAAQQHLIPKEA